MRVNWKYIWEEIIIPMLIFAIPLGIAIVVATFFFSPGPGVGTAIGTQTVYVHPTEVAYIDTDEVELATSGELVISFPHTPCTSITFGDVGKLSWDSGVMEFDGVAYLSATVFFECVLKPMIDDYIEWYVEIERKEE